ncbi:hypothetical protein [Paenibacillus cucumis (ex Kampfer et al. 2016)]|uniref:Tail fibre protein gp37 trimerization region domain-containing protein n=1 Tax=Paenibacillus cucumis (ex Kampfer et al. 2016) TaxID=1776858 RepID=A0ABS7KEX7_9BACL|nr:MULTISPECIES: hypothetical protein [Paenibacillus]MBY0202684.1 hypothetical protein [Paenibacillus cucumis (ex Kampfer et al. 2016)]
MSFEYYIASDRPIPEVKLRGQEILTAGDMIRMNVPDGLIPWKEMNENAKVLYGDPEASNRFHIDRAPYALKIMSKYTDLTHIYKFDAPHISLTKDLYQYITSLDKKTNLEIWHLWFGYDNEDEVILKKNFSLSTITLSDLDVVLNESWCITIKS